MTASINTTTAMAPQTYTVATCPVAAPARKTGFLRHLAMKWDMYGVMALMASSAAYGVFALAHVA